MLIGGGGLGMLCGANTPVRSGGGDIAYEKASGHGQEVHLLGLVAYIWEDGRASARGEGSGRVVFGAWSL